MKLKKIASLMLAGIMAVSMLAGCKDNPSSNSEPTTPVTPVTGAAAIVNGELNEKKDVISFSDSDVMTNLLTNYYKENPISGNAWNAGHNVLTDTKDTKLYDAMNDLIGVTDGKKIDKVELADHDTYGLKSSGEYTYCTIYYVNNDFVTEEDALRMAGQLVDDLDMPKDHEWVDNNMTKGLNFAYTGDIAAIEAESKGGTESVWVVAVAITLTATDK